MSRGRSHSMWWPLEFTSLRYDMTYVGGGFQALCTMYHSSCLVLFSRHSASLSFEMVFHSLGLDQCLNIRPQAATDSVIMVEAENFENRSSMPLDKDILGGCLEKSIADYASGSIVFIFLATVIVPLGLTLPSAGAMSGHH